MQKYRNITKLPVLKNRKNFSIDWRQLKKEIEIEKRKGFCGKLFHFIELEGNKQYRFRITEAKVTKTGQIQGFWIIYDSYSIELRKEDIKNANYDCLFKKYQKLLKNN